MEDAHLVIRGLLIQSEVLVQSALLMQNIFFVQRFFFIAQCALRTEYTFGTKCIF